MLVVMSKFVAVVEMTESWPRAEQAGLFLLRPLPHIEYHNTVTWVAPHWRIPNAILITM